MKGDFSSDDDFRRCDDCGSPVYKKGARLCMECKVYNQRENARQQNIKRHIRQAMKDALKSTASVEIVFDPDQECGFRKGARINTDELAVMLRDGHFTEGTIIRIKESRSKIVGQVGRTQKQEAFNG